MPEKVQQKWLVTLDRQVDLDQFLGAANKLGFGESGNAGAIPLDEEDKAIEVVGMRERKAELLRIPGVKAVHPSSDLELH